MRKKTNRNISNEKTDMFVLLIRKCLGVELVKEYRFAPGRRFRSDYALPDRKIAIEVEGGIWRKGGGAHSRPGNIVRDIEKNNLYVQLGWRLIRVQPNDLLKTETIKAIESLLKQ